MELRAELRVRTENASSYLQRLCKHFGHKSEVEFGSDSGSINFDFGRADLEATNDTLSLSAQADSDESLTHLKRILASHLERFAFREGLEVRWD